MTHIKRLLLKDLDKEKYTCEIFCFCFEKGAISVKSKQKDKYVKKQTKRRICKKANKKTNM